MTTWWAARAVIDGLSQSQRALGVDLGEAVDGVVLVQHGSAVGAASPDDAAEIVAELANGGRGCRVLSAGRGFSLCGVDQAVGVEMAAHLVGEDGAPAGV